MLKQSNPATTAFEHQLIQVLYTVDEQEEVEKLYLGRISSQDEQHDPEQVIGNTNLLVSELGNKIVHWSLLVLGGNRQNIGDPVYFGTLAAAERRRLNLNGITAGKYLTDIMFETLPIEFSEKGSGSIGLSMVVEDHIANFEATGYFQTVRTYEDENDLDTCIESTLEYTMDFYANIRRVEP